MDGKFSFGSVIWVMIVAYCLQQALDAEKRADQALDIAEDARSKANEAFDRIDQLEYELDSLRSDLSH